MSDLEAVSLPDSRLRLGSALLAVVSLGLLLSLLPRTSFVARSAGEIVDAVGPVWPEQSVEQVLDDGLGVVSEIRIWGAAGADRDEEAPVVAALLQGPDREVVRQDRVGIKASHLPQPYVLEFPPYHPAPGEALILQLWVTDERSTHAIFGTTEAGDDGAEPTINLNPTGKGPLAYEVIWRGDGWRAALAGSWLDQLRLAGGIAAAVMAVLLSPPVARRLIRGLGRFHAAALMIGRLIAAKLRPAGRWLAPQRTASDPASRRRALYVYPWLIPAFAILHYLANNLFLLRAHEAIVPGAVIMVGVTVVFLGLRVILGSAASAALLTGLLGIAFFSFGHIYVGPEDQPDSRHLFGIGIPVIGALVVLLRGRSTFPRKIGRFLNYASVVLLVAPLYQLGLVVFAAPDAQDGGVLAQPILIDERIDDVKARLDPDEMPDIYYIILDGYPRSGSPATFDNSEFVGQLEDRGFFVDPQARSNYIWTPSSTTSSLNMSYLDTIAHWDSPKTDIHKVYQVMLDHALGRILTDLGYTYMHVSSGWFMTVTNRNADIVVDFTDAGPTESEYTETDPVSHYPYTLENAINLSNRFMTNFLQTTFVKYFDRHPCFVCTNPGAYDWGHPYRALQWIDYMKMIGTRDGPKLVVSHIVKPHFPYTFDRHGNIAQTIGSAGEIQFGEWSDSHDPDVGGAFYGQIDWLNSNLLDVIDAIIATSDIPPIIVVMSDHGYIPGDLRLNTHDILAAYRLPRGGRDAIYSGITSVNVFRMILDYYFELNLGRLDDLSFSDEADVERWKR